jgi:hypothetical protein
MRKLLLVPIIAGCLFLQGAVARAAAVQGTFTVENPDVISVTPDDGECKIVLNETFLPSGDLQGTMNSHFRIEHMGPCGQPAPETFSARGTFTGSVLGTQAPLTTPLRERSMPRITHKEHWTSSRTPPQEGWPA